MLYKSIIVERAGEAVKIKWLTMCCIIMQYLPVSSVTAKYMLRNQLICTNIYVYILYTYISTCISP